MSQQGPHAAPGRPLVLGHRGASADAPENTLAAFRLAMEQGADGVELDVRRCATGEVVVFHDEDVQRIAGVPLRVAEVPWAALRGLDAGGWKGERFRGERIPLLEEVLEAVPGAYLNVELKGEEDREGLAVATAEVLRRAGRVDRVLVSSFDARLLRRFGRAAPQLPRGFLFEGRAGLLRAALVAPLLRPAAVHPGAALATPARVRRWVSRGLKVNVWTVDDPTEVGRLAALGVAALITDFPGRVRSQLSLGAA